MTVRLALVIAVAFIGCKPETARQSDRAADNVRQLRTDVRRAARMAPTRALVETAELTAAEQTFIEQKRIRIAALRGEVSVIGTQLALIGLFAEHAKITDASRADINNHLTAFKVTLDIARNQIEGLALTGADAWNERDDAVREAMNALESARKAAWRALEDAPRIDPRAS